VFQSQRHLASLNKNNFPSKIELKFFEGKIKNEIQNKYLTGAKELYALPDKNNVVIIDTREPEDYLVEHIPGAVNIYDIFTYLSTEENGGYLAMRNTFARVFGNAGISGNERIVIYEDAMDNGYGRSCRGYFILAHLGHKNVTVLHGGFQAWLQAGLPVTNVIPKPEAKQFIINVDNSLILSKEEMHASLDDPSIIKLDVRDHAEWNGVSSSPYGPDFAPRKGRLPNAVWLEWYNMMKSVNGIPWFKEPSELKEMFDKIGIHSDSTAYIYCFKGARTSNVYICMKMAGIENVKCYFGAWNEWSRDFSLPIDTGYPKKH
jgi:thiosulfate/3-mercaptopyruvate sulfurtransferase